jgi:hypothetical protein
MVFEIFFFIFRSHAHFVQYVFLFAKNNKNHTKTYTMFGELVKPLGFFSKANGLNYLFSIVVFFLFSCLFNILY